MNPNLDDIYNLESSFSDIVFIEHDHTYEIDGKKANCSVTKLLSKYTKPFDSDKMASIVAQKQGIDVSEVINLWDFKKDYANYKGTEFHKYVENFLSRKKTKIDLASLNLFFKNPKRKDFKNYSCVENYYLEFAKTIKNFNEFYSWYSKNYFLVKSEFVVGDKRANIAGTMDNLSFNIKKKEFEIFDYKTNSKFKMDNEYGEKLLPPFDHLENCEYHKYSLQLSLYKLIIERNTKYDIGDCHILWFGGDSYKRIPILDLKEEAEKILSLEEIYNETTIS